MTDVIPISGNSKSDDIGSQRLNGVTVDEALGELHTAYKVEPVEGEEAPDHPIIARQRRIAANVSTLEERVKGTLGESVKASHKEAEHIVKRLAYAIAQTEGHQGSFEDFKDEEVRRYLTTASNATGNPTFGNKTALVEGIMNLPSARPGDALYDSNSILATLINYVAAEGDIESKRITYLRSLIAEAWQKPGDAIKLQGALGQRFGIPLGPSATANDALGDLERVSSAEAQVAVAKTDKTYTQKPAYDKAA